MPAPATTVNTARSALISTFPWKTSAISAPKRKNFVRDAMLGLLHDKEVKDMLEVLAEQVDNAANMTIHDPYTRDFVHKFMATDEPTLSPEDMLERLLDMNGTISLSNLHVLSAAQIFFRYLLLDVCADAYNLPPALSNRLVSQTQRPCWGIDKMHKTVGLLRDWPHLIAKFCDMYSTVQDGSKGQASLAMPNGNAQQQVFIIGLQSLKRAHAHQASKHFDKVMLNVEILAFSIWWIRMGFKDFPRDKDELVEYLKTQSQDLDMPPEVLNTISNLTDMTSTMAVSMRNVLHLALSISPLLMLIPKKFNMTGIRRDHLITHALSLGNDKPPQLREAEQATWFFVFNLAAGLDKAEQLERYLDRLRAVSVTNLDKAEQNWFVRDANPHPIPSSQQHASSSLPPPVPPPPPSAKGDAAHHDAASGDEAPSNPQGEKRRLTRIDEEDEEHPERQGEGEDEEEEEEEEEEEPPGRQLRPRPCKQTIEPYREMRGRHEKDKTKGKETSCNRPHARLLKAPDLPLPAVAEKPFVFSRTPKSVLPMAKVQPEVLSPDVVHLRLHCANRDHPPINFDFSAPQPAAKLEHRLLLCTQKAIESLFINGRPPHHTDSAHDIDDSSVSAFFVVNKETFSKMTPNQIQAIFRRRHILIPATSPPEIKFDRHGLSTLGCLTTERQIQVNSQNKKLYAGTLLDLLAADAQGKRRVLNILEIRMGGAPIVPPPGYSHLASDEQAWQATRDLPAMLPLTFPSDDMHWGTAATSNATSWHHLDDYGLGTVVQNMAGKKYWVVARPKIQDPDPSGYGNLASRFAFHSSWDTSLPGDKYWDYEGVVLEPGDTLYMQPNTLHYVVTMEDSFTYGRHFLSCSTIQATVCGIVHCFMMGYCITNTQHNDLGTLLRRMMSMWHIHYNQQTTFLAPQDAHIPDISTVEGLMDMMALGNCLELAQVLDRRTYRVGSIGFLEQQEMAMARWRYRLLQKLFAKNFVVFTAKQQIHAMSVFRRSLVEFAAALLHYKADTATRVNKSVHFTAENLQTKIFTYFKSNFAELIPAVRKSVESGVHSFVWSGPKLTVKLRTTEHQQQSRRHRPDFNFDDLVLYDSPHKHSSTSSSQDKSDADQMVETQTDGTTASTAHPGDEEEQAGPLSASSDARSSSPPTTNTDGASTYREDEEMADGTAPSSESLDAGPSNRQKRGHRELAGGAVKRQRKK